MRLKHPDLRPNASVRFTFDGTEIEALDGETIAAALGARHVTAVREARSGAPRGPFCGMGVCFDCLVTVNGRPSQRACLTKVEAGLDVRSAAPAPVALKADPPEPVQEIACDVLVLSPVPLITGVVVRCRPIGMLKMEDEAGADAEGVVEFEGRRFLGFVYQYHHLLPEFSALENVMLPQMLNGLSRSEAKLRAAELLAMVHLKDRADHRPGRLSGGEQQRVAIARAVANAPRVLLADEPTGNLDSETADTVFRQLLALVRETGMGALIATHNHELAARMDRTVHLRDGQLS